MKKVLAFDSGAEGKADAPTVVSDRSGAKEVWRRTSSELFEREGWQKRCKKSIKKSKSLHFPQSERRAGLAWAMPRQRKVLHCQIVVRIQNSFLIGEDFEGYAAIDGTTFFCAIVCYWTFFSVAFITKPLCLNAMVDEIIYNGFGALLRKP